MHEDAVPAAFGLSPLLLATVIFAATYALIMAERLNRAVVALLGAGLLIFFGVLNQERAIAAVDFNTIGLLIGMMIIVAITKRCGVFQYLAIWGAKKAKASPAGIMLMLQTITAVTSAVLDNVTTVLLVVPVALVIIEDLKVSPLPFLISIILASNIGGTATLIGDPPNILIGSRVGLSFNDFLVNLAPVIVIIQAVTCLVVHLAWGRRLRTTAEARQRVMNFNERAAITDSRLMKQSVGVIAAVIVLFVLARTLDLEPATIAMFGAAVLMLLYVFGRSPEEQSEKVTHIFNEVEWITIFFFIGLFMVVAGIEHAGLLKIAAEELITITGGDLQTTVLAILWTSAVLSAVVDNIPFVATMIPLIKTMAPAFGGPEGLMPLWWALSLGACLGGNGTLIGASANLTVAGIAERAGYPLRFLTYTKYAVGVMVIGVAISMIYLELRYL